MRLNADEQRRFEVDTTRWCETDDASRLLRIRMVNLLEDWGACLELPLYAEALTHFLGGEQTVLHLVPLTRGGVPLGNQQMQLLAPGVAFRLTALSEAAGPYELQLRALLAHTPLRLFHWINLARHRVEFVTLTK